MADAQNDIVAQITGATQAMEAARDMYTSALTAMTDLEASRSKLVGSGPTATRVTGLLQKYGPALLKFGTAIAGGGGITALMADPGAFAGILSNLGSVLGIG